MKKLFLLIVLCFFSLNAQVKKQPIKKNPQKLTEQQLVEKKAREYFEKEFVQNNFKDPYSYELKKMWTEPITFRGIKEDSITYHLLKVLDYEKIQSDRGFALNIPEKKEQDFHKYKQQTIENELSRMSEVDKNTVIGYKIYFDTYAANSFGNKVLGRYFIKMWKNGERLSDVEENKK